MRGAVQRAAMPLVGRSRVARPPGATGVRAPWRNALTWALVGGVVVALLAGPFFWQATDDRRRQFEQAAQRELALVLSLVPPRVDRARAEALARTLGGRSPDGAVVTYGGGTAASTARLTLTVVPDTVRSQVLSTGSGAARTDLDGSTYLVVGGRAREPDTGVYLFYSEQQVSSDVGDLGTSLALLGTCLVSAAALAGFLRARSRASSLAVRREQERRFSAHMAHELRTPVSAMVTAASLVEQGPDHEVPPALRDPLGVLVAEARRLRRIVDDLLELSRLERGEYELRDETVSLAVLVSTVVRSCGWEDRVTVRSEEDVEVSADRRSLARVVLNLVGNALAHGGGAALVAIAASERQVTLEVVDDGPGIPEEALAHLFEPFSSGRGRPQNSGTGLGLAIARVHAELLGGHLTARSGQAGGACLRLTLPAPAARRTTAGAPETDDAVV